MKRATLEGGKDANIILPDADIDAAVSTVIKHAHRVAEQLECGRVVINGAPHAPLAPFGGFKQSGIGREYGRYGLEAHLEVRAILG